MCGRMRNGVSPPPGLPPSPHATSSDPGGASAGWDAEIPLDSPVLWGMPTSASQLSLLWWLWVVIAFLMMEHRSPVVCYNKMSHGNVV